MELDIFLKKLIAVLHLGSLLQLPSEVSGGLMHRMFKLQTTSGTYVAKLLNPNVMKREDAMGNYIEADRLEDILLENHLPIIDSLKFNSKKMQEIDGQFFYLYKWFEGKTLKDGEITKLHCKKVGKALSSIHGIECLNNRLPQQAIEIDWDYYLELTKQQLPLLHNLLSKSKHIILQSQTKGNTAISQLPAISTICHNDMDCKNVMWLEDEMRIIDMECLGYGNPYMELFELALCWSGYESCKIDFELFSELILAYFSGKTKPVIDWEIIYYSNYGRLLWLEYNLKRGLQLECGSAEEQKIGIEQAVKTIEQIIYYASIKDEILRNLSLV